MKEDFTQRTRLLIGAENMKRLSEASVLVFGVGGVGSYCVEALARAGIGHLMLVDGDRVNETNINRQLIALHSTIGQYKCDVAQNRIRDINPAVQIEIYNEFYTADNAENIDFTRFDYIADAIDSVSAKLLIIERAKHAGIPLISAMGAGNRLDPARFEITDIYKTKDCPLARVMRRELRLRGITDLKVVFSPEAPFLEYNENTADSKMIGSLSCVPSSAGLLMASAVINDLCMLS